MTKNKNGNLMSIELVKAKVMTDHAIEHYFDRMYDKKR